MNLVPSTTRSGSRRIMLLAPSTAAVPKAFAHVDLDAARHETLLAQMQRLRGEVYLNDGAIKSSQLCPDGRHRLPVDDRSWHALTFDSAGTMIGCARYCAHPAGVDYYDLELVSSALAQDSRWSEALRVAVEADIDLAQRLRMSFVEVGGWALSRAARGTTEALRIVLATYGLADVLGGCIGMSTATVRNCSASILRRIGGESLFFGGQPLPRYFDPSYDCEMEILRFDSRCANPQFRERIKSLGLALTDLPIICAGTGRQAEPRPLAGVRALAQRCFGSPVPTVA